jgi:tRNA(fMet)-specific endonuclease VapC
MDTVAAIALLNQDAAALEMVKSSEVFLSCIVVGELQFGAENSTRREQNLAKLAQFLEGQVILPVDRLTSTYYGYIKRLLKQKGRMIPANDIWIAATAVQYDLTLMSQDAHFNAVDGLAVSIWQPSTE